VEALEPVGQVVEQRALGLDHARELVDQALGVVAGVGVGAFGVEHAHERTGALALGGGSERRGGHLVRGEAGVRRTAEHLATSPASASFPRRCGGRSATCVPAP
jgi:hypothetical protein